MSRPRVVLTTRELFPFGGGGIGVYVALMARTLAPIADVTIVAASWFREEYEERRSRSDPDVEYGGADVLFAEVPEGEEFDQFDSHMHVYSHRVLECIRTKFGARGPDLIEFPDYLGEGFVATEARRTGDPFLADTTIALRFHTSAEMCEVLNGHLELPYERRFSRELERRTLREADVVLVAGGDILESYRRFYGIELPPARTIRHPLEGRVPVAGTAVPDGPLRILYAGRCERRKGVQDLCDALLAIPGDWHLTLLGADTPTAPLARSMRRTLELRVDGDPRVDLVEATGRADLPARMAEHDVVAMPSRWECWPYIALEAMAAGVPLVAPAVGGLTELVRPGVSGWHASGVGRHALHDVLEPLVRDPGRARALRHGPGMAEHLDALVDAEQIRSDYLALLAERRTSPTPTPATITGRHPRAEPPPLVSVVIPYHGMSRWVEDTVASVDAQDYERIETIVVNDGSFAPEDVVLASLSTRYPIRVISQENRGLGAARNAGIVFARGRYILPLDADNLLDPSFVRRSILALERDPDLAYVTAWNRFVDEDGTPLDPPHNGYRPIGNWSALVGERNVAGDGTAVVRREVFRRHAYSEDLTSFEDWAFYRELARAGRTGRVIPEVLWSYRIRHDSMLRSVGLAHEERLAGEMEALIKEREVTWMSASD